MMTWHKQIPVWHVVFAMIAVIAIYASVVTETGGINEPRHPRCNCDCDVNPFCVEVVR